MFQEFLSQFVAISTKSVDIIIESIDQKSLEQYAENRAERPYAARRHAKKIKAGTEIDFDESNDFWLYSSGLNLYWTRMGREGIGDLAGGFYINGATMIFLTDQQKFWERSEMAFDQLENKEELLDDPRDLSWFESTTAVNGPIATPHFGCTKIKASANLDEFYFYDSGKLYDLSFSSIEEYFNAMFSTAAVECWQYFFIPPEVIIEKNKALPYITWKLHLRSQLEEGIELLQYNPNIKFDRLDLIDEYLKRCVTLLPKSFPYLDFSHHIEYYENFHKLYEASK